MLDAVKVYVGKKKEERVCQLATSLFWCYCQWGERELCLRAEFWLVLKMSQNFIRPLWVLLGALAFKMF